MGPGATERLLPAPTKATTNTGQFPLLPYQGPIKPCLSLQTFPDPFPAVPMGAVLGRPCPGWGTATLAPQEL